MKQTRLEPQPATVIVDEATEALLDEARESIRRGEVFTLDQSREYAREQYRIWQEQQDKANTPA